MANNFKTNLIFDQKKLKEKVDSILNGLDKYYSPEYVEHYKKHFSAEYAALKNEFPKIDFDYEGRIKNVNSLSDKIYKKINEGKSGNIYDIYAKKIVVHSVNGSKEEKDLINACYEIKNFLLSYNKSITAADKKSKDYIANPKKNGYQALHILRNHDIGNDMSHYSEVQIRTFRMEEHQKYGDANHYLYYKPNPTLKKELCPIFLEIGKKGKTHVLSKKDSLAKYTSEFDALIESITNSNSTQQTTKKESTK